MPRIIDLTLPLTPSLRGVSFETARELKRDGWNARNLHLYSHAGTHMDAQTHFGAGTETIDAIPLDRLVGPARIARLYGLPPKALITLDSIGTLVDDFTCGDALLLATGWSAYVEDAALYRDALPRLSVDFARWCVARRVRVLGVEPPSVADVNNLAELTEVHQILLAGGVTIVEGLAYLDRIQADRFLFCAFPLPIEGGDGSPCRAFAVENIDPEAFA